MQTLHNNTTDSIKQINLQAAGVLDDLTHYFRCAKSRIPIMLGIFYQVCYIWRFTNILLNNDIKLNLCYFQ